MKPGMIASVLLAVIALLSAMPSLAQQPPPIKPAVGSAEGPSERKAEQSNSRRWRRPGWYIGATGLYGFELRAEDLLRDLDPSIRVSNSPGFSGRLGYQGEIMFAGEVRTEYATGFDVRSESVGGFTYDLLTTTFNLLLFWPGGSLGRFDPYLYAGMGFTRIQFEDEAGVLEDEEDYGVGYTGGFGVNWYLDENWSFGLELGSAAPGGVNSDSSYLSVGAGARYQF